MKKIITGTVFSLVGAIIFLSVFHVAGIYASVITSWYTASGKFWTAVSELNLYPVFVIGIIMMVVGIVFLIWGNFHKEEQERG